MDTNTNEIGLIQVYTGNGKGKTTAAIGLAIRAAGAGKKVFFCQFLKGQYCSEVSSLNRFNDLITLERHGKESFVMNVSKEDIEFAENGIKSAKKAIGSGQYNLVILDEINAVIDLKLIELHEIIDTIKQRPSHVEIVCTGRNAHLDLITIADLVTEMREIKHYFNKGTKARVGIEM